MKRLIFFTAVSMALAWSELSSFREAVAAVLLFGGLLGILRFAGYLIFNEERSWSALRERVTQIMIVEGALLFFCWLSDHVAGVMIAWSSGARALLIALEILPPLIFALLALGIVRVSLGVGGKTKRSSSAAADVTAGVEQIL